MYRKLINHLAKIKFQTISVPFWVMENMHFVNSEEQYLTKLHQEHLHISRGRDFK